MRYVVVVMLCCRLFIVGISKLCVIMTDQQTNNINDIEVSLVDTITDDNLSQLFGNIGESVLDTMLSDGVMQNIPIIDSIYKGGKIIVSIRDQFFAKKVLKFLLQIKDISATERQKFIDELEEKTGQKAGETLVVLLDRLDNIEKPLILSNLLKSKIKGEISLEKFLRLASILDRGFLPDLKKLCDFELTNSVYHEDITEILFSLGLLYQAPITGIVQTFDKNLREDNSVNEYKISGLGLDLLKYGLNNHA